MRNPFRREPRSGGRSSLIERLSRRRGAYTVEIPEVGTGHYIFDPSDGCSVHSKRLEAWCDVEDFDTAREELHWHCMTLSQLGGDAERIREMGAKLIEGRQEKVVARRQAEGEAEIAAVEGGVQSVPARVKAQREAISRAEVGEQRIREEAEAHGRKRDELRDRFNALPRRARVQVGFKVVIGVSISFTVFDVGVMGSAFHLIPGELIWKIVLTFGVALAPISTAVGIAQWLSAAEAPIREGVKATWLAFVAGLLAIIGIGLIVLFRAAATSDSAPLPVHAYAFLAFIQSALAMAEAMIYTVYFDGKVGRALLERIAVAEKEIEGMEQAEAGERANAQRAQVRIGEIETAAEKEAAELKRQPERQAAARREEEGAAVMLEAIVEHAIQEGAQAAERSERRKESEAALGLATRQPAFGVGTWAVGGVALIVSFLLGRTGLF